MSTRYSKNNARASHPFASDPFWVAVSGACIVAFLLVALPAIIVGFFAQRALARSPLLNWRARFLVWIALAVGSFSFLFLGYYHGGMQPLLYREIADYVLAAKRSQLNLTQWPIGKLLADTWPMWIHTLPGAGLVGLWQEVRSEVRADTANVLRQHERRRQRKAIRSQQKAKRRTNRPNRLPDAIGGMMTIGVPIHDEEEE